MTPLPIGAAIRVVRRRRDLSQAQLADIMSEHLGNNVTQSYISKVEVSAKTMSLLRLQQLCACLEVRVSEIVTIAETMNVVS
jgi:transcriptional regulator with XRE-family HTH domain